MSHNFDIFPHSLSHLDHNECVFSSLGLTVYWGLTFEDDCHGPVYHSRYESCVVRLDAERSKFQEELIAISNRFQVSPFSTK